jgi:SET domain-containing protein
MPKLFATRRSRILLAGAALVAFAALGVGVYSERRRYLRADTRLDRRTVVKPSQIPGAGNGLFAARFIPKDDRIAELGGRLAASGEPFDHHYSAQLPPCAASAEAPFAYLDARFGGGNGAMINFAPLSVNGVDLGLRNADLVAFCRRPYIGFVASRDIPAGEEIFTSYGSDYEYDFMAFPAVKAFFCARAGVDCSERYEWRP